MDSYTNSASRLKRTHHEHAISRFMPVILTDIGWLRNFLPTLRHSFRPPAVNTSPTRSPLNTKGGAKTPDQLHRPRAGSNTIRPPGSRPGRVALRGGRNSSSQVIDSIADDIAVGFRLWDCAGWLLVGGRPPGRRWGEAAFSPRHCRRRANEHQRVSVKRTTVVAGALTLPLAARQRAVSPRGEA